MLRYDQWRAGIPAKRHSHFFPSNVKLAACASNSTMLAPGFYMNEWTALSPEQRTQFHASPDEIHHASETRDKRLLRHQLRKQKNVMFKAILEVGNCAVPYR